MKRPDETTAFWMTREHGDLAQRTAALHKQRRIAAEEAVRAEVNAVRKSIADMFITGNGIEVGAGSRPFPIPTSAKCLYGDIRDEPELRKYFSTSKAISAGSRIDAQTFDGIADGSLDFVISAHVIEHLFDPIGSIKNAIRVLSHGGIHLLVVPDMRHTFDMGRRPTSLQHLIRDSKDGGEGTKLEAYIEFIKDVAIPRWGHKFNEYDIAQEAQRLADKNHDIHVHAWTAETFREMLDAIDVPYSVLGQTSVRNEAIFVLKKH